MFNVLGIEFVDYVSKNGKAVKGVKYHCSYEDPKKVQGLAVTDVYINSDMVDTLYAEGVIIQIGSVIEVYYNKYGSIAKLELVK